MIRGRIPESRGAAGPADGDDVSQPDVLIRDEQHREGRIEEDAELGPAALALEMCIERERLVDPLGRQIDRVLSLEVPEGSIVDRISGRRVCLDCGQAYHVRYNAPPPSGRCGSCNSERVVQRSDDTEETVRTRHAAYLKDTLPILAHYGRRDGVVVGIDGMGSVEDVTQRLVRALGS